jgi:hypothetical protein
MCVAVNICDERPPANVDTARRLRTDIGCAILVVAAATVRPVEGLPAVDDRAGL